MGGRLALVCALAEVVVVGVVENVVLDVEEEGLLPVDVLEALNEAVGVLLVDDVVDVDVIAILEVKIEVVEVEAK